MNTERTLRWSAGAVAGVGVAYVFVLGIGIARFGTLRPIDNPVLAWMEVLTICSAWLLVSLVARKRELPYARARSPAVTKRGADAPRADPSSQLQLLAQRARELMSIACRCRSLVALSYSTRPLPLR